MKVSGLSLNKVLEKLIKKPSLAALLNFSKGVEAQNKYS